MSVHRLRALIVLGALGLAARASAGEPTAAAAAKPEVPRLGVVVGVRVNVTVEEGDLLADRLGDAIRDALVVDVIAGSEVTRRLVDMPLPDDCVATPACTGAVAKRLDADELLFLVIVRVGNTFQIEPTWIGVADGRVAARDRIVIQDDDKLPERVFKGVARRLLPHLPERKQSVVVIGGPGAPGPKPRGRHMTRGAWIAGSIGAVGLVGGAVFGTIALTENNALESDHCDTMACPNPSRIDTLQRNMDIADVLFVVGAAGAGTAAVLWYTSSEEEPPRARASATVVPMPGGGLFVQAAGSF